MGGRGRGGETKRQRTRSPVSEVEEEEGGAVSSRSGRATGSVMGRPRRDEPKLCKFCKRSSDEVPWTGGLACRACVRVMAREGFTDDDKNQLQDKLQDKAALRVCWTLGTLRTLKRAFNTLTLNGARSRIEEPSKAPKGHPGAPSPSTLLMVSS